MPLYICNARKGAIADAAKQKIAADITRIHCEETGAPASFVHAFFFEEAAQPPLADKTAFLFGSIRTGRTDAQKARLIDRMLRAIETHAGVAKDDVAGVTMDVPASWVMEGGDVLPEPGEEGDWIVAHEAKLAATKAD